MVRLNASAMIIALAMVAVGFMAIPEASAAVLSAGSHVDHHGWLGAFAQASVALIALRKDLQGLVQRAEQKQAEIKDDTAEEQRRSIEADHAELLRQIEAKKTEIAEKEAEEAEAARRAAPANVDASAAVAAALRADRERAKKIREIGKNLRLDAAFVEEHAAGETSVATFRELAIDKMAASDGNRSGPQGTAQVTITRDEAETARRGMVDALVARFARASGERNVTIPDHARKYGEMGMVEIAAECIGYVGSLRTSRQVSEVFDEAFARRNFVGMSASDFPGIFLDAMNKRLLARYQVAMPTYRRFAAPYTAADFRAQNVIRAGDFPSLVAVGEDGEIKSGTFSESKEVARVAPYGVRLNISRVMIVNDNLSAIDQVLGSAGIRVSDWENAQAFTALLSGSGAGPTLLTDSKAVFHTDHGNLAGTPAAISVTSIGIGRASMMKQTTLDGIKANFTPVVILTGPDKQTEAEQLVTSITPAQSSNAVPESIKRLVPVADANISGNAWYLFADPVVAPTFVYSYLEGFEGPRLTSREEFSVQGMSVKLEHDFGVSAIDYRGAFRNAGA